jgi:hypothetical protein
MKIVLKSKNSRHIENPTGTEPVRLALSRETPILPLAFPPKLALAPGKPPLIATRFALQPRY